MTSNLGVGWAGRSWQTVSTFAMIAVTLAVDLIYRNNVFAVALATAAIGGFVHEIVQSGGSVAYPQARSDGLYLGSISGLLFGVVAGMLLLQGLPPATTVDTPLLSQTFFAGLGLKGVAEAAGGQVAKGA